MRRSWFLQAALTVLLAAITALGAHEPDGRVSIRYAWEAATATDGSRPLRVAVTAVVALSDVRLRAAVPLATSVNIRAVRIGGAAPMSSLAGRWPDAGVSFGRLAAGQSIVFDLDVVEPAEGGGILALGVDAAAGDRVVKEGVGIPVGTPGVVPTLRNGALEFPAQQGEPAP